MKLVIKDLTKTYKNGVKAIDNLSIEIGTGMFGLLGPNGAGKTTILYRTKRSCYERKSNTICFYKAFYIFFCFYKLSLIFKAHFSPSIAAEIIPPA